MELKEQILKALGLSSEVKFEVQAKLEDGTIIVSTAEALVEGADVSVLTEDGTTIDLPIGEYKTEDGVVFDVEEAGIIARIGETEEVEEEVEEEGAPVEEETVEASEEEVVEAAKEDDEDYADVGDWEGMEKRIQNLEDAVADLKRKVGDEEEVIEEVVEATEETAEPSKNPKSIKTTEVVEFSVEELKAENERLKAELSKKPAATPVELNKFANSEKSTKLSTSDYRNLSRKERYWYNIKNNNK